jgi:agmatinase
LVAYFSISNFGSDKVKEILIYLLGDVITLTMKTFIGYDNTPLNQARFIILPLPYEVTTSYIKGTRKGPSAIISASANVETYDEELEKETYKTAKIHTSKIPDLDFRARPEKFIPSLNKYIKSLIKKLSSEQVLISLGGEHSISYPIVSAYQEAYKDLSVLHLDAHSDLRESYAGSIYSHACVMKRIYNSKVKSIVQMGIRNLTQDCMELIRRTSGPGCTTLKTFFAHKHQPPLQDTPNAFGEIKEILNTLFDNVYVTIDLDVFDPSVIPAVGTPEPGGLCWYDVLEILRPVFGTKRVVAFDVVELCPIDNSIVSDFISAKLIYRLMGYISQYRKV